jgi:hypothetical protein
MSDLSTWEKFWMVILGIFCFWLIFAMVWFLFAEKPVVRYELSGYAGQLQIRVDIENCADSFIPLIGVDYEYAITIIDSLNSGLVKHPRKEKK